MRHIKTPVTLYCDVCKNNFISSHKTARACSRICRLRRQSIISGRTSFTGLPTGTVGAISEMEIAVDLMRKGFAVFRSLSPACFCDLICVKEKQILRVECKTGYINASSGSLNFPKKVHGEIDIFAVFVQGEKRILYFEPDLKTVAKI